MKILQLGNGGGLNPRLVNSAFLIDLHDDHSEYLLFDCGFNIMVRLMDLEEEDKFFSIDKIKHVVISHNHADHTGSLETLIYWNHFKNNIQMNIYVACKGLAKTVKDTRKIVDNFKIVKAKTYNSLTIVNEYGGYTLSKEHTLEFNKGDHGAKKAYGMLISTNLPLLPQSFFISGDTKATIGMEQMSYDADLVFHDFSNWDDESKNVHACATDFERVYSQEFRSKAIKYHTGSEGFNRDWQG